ncbi:hypothetical protein MHBO_001072 [Bonamia ostreae]|uniref:Uncharacterized protein n=1 Tax=Bonamia ostreae TaxID=126728 RepID=A0ABV2AHR2_9EUKA
MDANGNKQRLELWNLNTKKISETVSSDKGNLEYPKYEKLNKHKISETIKKIYKFQNSGDSGNSKFSQELDTTFQSLLKLTVSKPLDSVDSSLVLDTILLKAFNNNVEKASNTSEHIRNQIDDYFFKAITMLKFSFRS